MLRQVTEGLAERGFTGEALDGIRRAADAQDSDLFDVLAFIAYARPPLKRSERANIRREVIIFHYGEKQRNLLDFVWRNMPWSARASWMTVSCRLCST